MPPHEPFALIDCTLREGEQFATVRFSSAQRLAIAEALDAFGVEYIELTSPAASPQSARDLALIARRGLRARVLTHVRCHPDDARLAVECGAQGVNLLYATSETLRRASHGRAIETILSEAEAVIGYLRRHNVEVRFSCEDTFRTDPAVLARVYAAVAAMGVRRVGLADTVGIATLFARILFRNALNLGIPCFTADLTGQLRDGQEVELSLEHGSLLTDDGRTIQLPPPPAFLREVWAAGGIVPFYRTHGRFPGEGVTGRQGDRVTSNG